MECGFSAAHSVPPGRYTREMACFYQHVVPDGTPEIRLYVVYFAFLSFLLSKGAEYKGMLADAGKTQALLPAF
jgi:hypothetical protein